MASESVGIMQEASPVDLKVEILQISYGIRVKTDVSAMVHIAESGIMSVGLKPMPREQLFDFANQIRLPKVVSF